jgi:hypothetical protein
MKRSALYGVLLASAAVLTPALPACAQGKTIAVMPSLYFSAEPQSATNITTGLAQQFERQGYSVTPASQSQQAFQAVGLEPTRHYADSAAIKFGKQVGAQLVAYPRLLAVGAPYAGLSGGIATPNAVILLRVINVRTGAYIYCRQVAYEFKADAREGESFVLPQPIADATAEKVTQEYFARVKGSRLEN